MLGFAKPTGSLKVKKIPAGRPPLMWRLSNVLRWSYIKGWFATFVIAPLAQLFGVMTALGKLEAVKYTFANDKDRETYFKMLREALGIHRSDVEHRTIHRLIRLKKKYGFLSQTTRAALDAIEAWRVRVSVPVNFGVLGFRVVTTAFVNFVVDQLQTETSVFGDFKYHDAGVGTTAENAADTAIETTDGEARATGTQTESASNAYRSVGTISYTSTKAVTEHGLFNDSSAGTLMDRTVFSAVNVVNGDSIQFTYTITLSSGG